MTRHTNWIGGCALPSRAGLFDLPSRLDGKSLGEWPLSGKREVDLWLASINSAGELVRASGEQLEAAWRKLVELSGVGVGIDAHSAVQTEESAEPQSSGLEHLADRLGLSAASAHSFLDIKVRYNSFGLGTRAPTGVGPVVISCEWGHSASELFGLIAECLFAGRAVLLIASPDLPMVAGLVTSSFANSPMDPRSVSLLHGALPEAWVRLAESGLPFMGRLGGVARKSLASFASLSRALEETLIDLPSPQETKWNVPSGLLAAARSAPKPSGISAQEFEQSSGDWKSSIQTWAIQLAREAFGEMTGFGGLRHGAPLIAAIPRRIYSVFAEALIEELESLSKDAQVSGFESSTGKVLATHYHSFWSSGLDEGATLVSGGDSVATMGGGVCLQPALLLNLKPDSALLKLGEPLGVLRLQRA